jgi:cobalamin synthase
MLKIMSPTATATKRKKKKKSSSAGWMTWWPLLVGIAVTPLTVRMAAVMALAGLGALRALYPYVQLLQSHALGFSGDIAGTLSQAMMYLQFPLYGLLMTLVLRSKGFLHALITTAIVHFGAVAIVVALAHL